MVLPLAYIAAELAFESPNDAHLFLLSHQAAVYQAADPSKTQSGEDSRSLDCKAVRPILAAALQSYTKVDIKCVFLCEPVLRADVCNAEAKSNHFSFASSHTPLYLFSLGLPLAQAVELFTLCIRMPCKPLHLPRLVSESSWQETSDYDLSDVIK
jgi:hypothetical protein